MPWLHQRSEDILALERLDDFEGFVCVSGSNVDVALRWNLPGGPERKQQRVESHQSSKGSNRGRKGRGKVGDKTKKENKEFVKLVEVQAIAEVMGHILVLMRGSFDAQQ